MVQNQYYDVLDDDTISSCESEKYVRTLASNEEGSEFQAGDHVYTWCWHYGFLPYQHHGIVVSVLNDGQIEVAHFVPAEDETSSSMPHSLPLMSRDPGLFSSQGCVRPSSKEITKTSRPSEKETTDNEVTAHGIRIDRYDSGKWCKEVYKEDVGESRTVLARVEFLMLRSELIPNYELFQSNCECVAVWCKTGKYATRQITRLLGSGLATTAGVGAVPVATTVSVPASGVMGWLGATTTATVPVCAASVMPGIAISGGAIAFKWAATYWWHKQTEAKLNNEFIGYLTNDGSEV